MHRPRFLISVATATILLGAGRAEPANEHILDAFEQQAGVQAGFSFNLPLPLSQITARCGDDDGCTVRLVVFEGTVSPSEAAALGARLFSTDPTGTNWVVSTFDGVGSGGTTGDSPAEMIFGLTASGVSCSLFDAVAGGYSLLAVASPSARVDCVLRIDD
ncbi:MAG: hypothetical protein ACE5GX_10705 [Thermoanaerobaculia bacterium]